MNNDQNLDMAVIVGAVGAQQLVRDMRTIGSEGDKQFDRVAVAADKGNAAVRSFADQFPLLGRAMRAITSPTGILVGAVVGLGLAFGAGKAAATEFNHEFLELANLNLGKSAAEIRDLKDTVLETAADSGKGASEMSKAFFDLQSGTTLAKDEIAELAGTFADFSIATKADFNTTVEGAVKQIRAFGLSATEAKDLLASNFATVQLGITTFDELARVQVEYAGAAAAAGQTVDSANATFAALTATTKDTGIAATQARAAFIDLGKSATVKGLKKVGVEVFDMKGNMRDVRDIMKELVPQFVRMSEQEFNALKEEIGGSEGLRGLLDTAYNSGEDLLDVFERFDSAKGAFDMDTLLANAAGDFETLSQIVDNQMNTVMIHLGEIILPTLARALNALVGVLRPVAKWVSNNSSLLEGLTKAVIAGTAAWIATRIAILAYGRALGAVRLLYPFLISATIAYNTANTALGGAVNVAKVAVQGLWNVMRANPIGFIVGAVGVLVAAFSSFGDEVEETDTKVLGLVESLGLLSTDTEKSVDDISAAIQRVKDGSSDAATEVGLLKKALADVESQLSAVSTTEIDTTSPDFVNVPLVSEEEAGRLQVPAGSLAVAISNFEKFQNNNIAEQRGDIVAELNETREAILKGIKDIEDAANDVDPLDPLDPLFEINPNSLAALENQIGDLSKYMREDVEFASDAFFSAGVKVDLLKDKIELANLRLKQLIEGMEKVEGQDVTTIFSEDEEPLPTRSIESLGIGEDGENGIADVADTALTAWEEFVFFMANETVSAVGTVAEGFAELGGAISDMVTQAFGDFVFGVGQAIGAGEGFISVLKALGQAVLVEVPKYVGMFLLQQGVGLGWPIGIPSIVAGIGLLALSGIASGLLGGGGSTTSDIGTGTLSDAGNDVRGGLGQFNAEEVGESRVTLRAYFDGEEITNIILSKIDLESELQLGG